MKIKNLMDFLNKEAPETQASEAGSATADQSSTENIVYIENARLETVAGNRTGRELSAAGSTRWAEESMGDILVSQGRLNSADINRIIDYQRDKGLYFGEAAIELGLVTQDDILRALSSQFGYSYGHDEPSSKDMIMAAAPFSEVAEQFRSIRARLISDWLTPSNKTLAIVSPSTGEGRSYFAANIALAFAQTGRSTLLIDADLRSPRQHEIFSVTGRVGLSTLLAGRIRMDELDMLPDRIAAFPYLSVLASGPVPPNPAELLGNDRFPTIVRNLEDFFDVVIIDCPAALYKSDIMSAVSVAGSALMITRRGYSSIADSKALMTVLRNTRTNVVGAVMNQF